MYVELKLDIRSAVKVASGEAAPEDAGQPGGTAAVTTNIRICRQRCMPAAVDSCTAGEITLWRRCGARAAIGEQRCAEGREGGKGTAAARSRHGLQPPRGTASGKTSKVQS